jgi:Holliday junction DNA helicase RuvA
MSDERVIAAVATREDEAIEASIRPRRLDEYLGQVAGVNRAAPATSDILNALLALGYSDKEAVAAVKELPAEVAVADGIRQALKRLSKA